MGKKDVVIRLGGEAGQGIITAGKLISKGLKRNGYYSYLSWEYPSLIKGGHNYCDIRFSSQMVHANSYKVDVLIALNSQTIALHTNNMNKDGLILYDRATTLIENKRSDCKYLDLPLQDLAKLQGNPLYKNTLAAAATLAVFNLANEEFRKVVIENFKEKGIEITKKNEQQLIKLALLSYLKVILKDNNTF